MQSLGLKFCSFYEGSLETKGYLAHQNEETDLVQVE